ncbi:YbaK/EbsC family protein [Allopusillimonas ginsengisoli]|uniref:YbaK/EbsC family protein n=1 Tax=Allopusillimonas ginsengisoli TaxID=453575 RepID=UPI0010217FA8|nr:YbaK/EbsC family protein [Allopusillimonas ginsengisoli]TEA78957.1 YbaK/EbsC family protein [Allopusillimonas ginsengisoli]
MSIESVQQFLQQHAPDITIIETSESTATVALAAAVHGVEPGQIAKTLSLRTREQVVLVVTRGDARLDNKKLKAAFGNKVKMLDTDSVLALTGHPVGGVCPFGLATDLPVYCDVSLKDYDIVMPAAGSMNSTIRIAPDRLVGLVGAQWIDVSQLAQTEA